MFFSGKFSAAGIAAALFFLLGAACTPKRVVTPRYPTPSASPANYGAVGLQVRGFVINGSSDKDGMGDWLAMEKMFTEYVSSAARFREVQARNASVKPPVLLLDVVLDVHHTSWRTYILDLFFFYPCSGYFPLTPQWGAATVRVNATAFGEKGDAVWRATKEANAGYWMLFYTWYRTGPEEAAYAEAYGEAFRGLADQLAADKDKVIAAIGPAAAARAAIAAQAPVEPLPPDERKTLVVMDLKPLGDVSQDEAMVLSERVRADVSNSARFTVVSREEMDNIMKEQQFQKSDVCDNTKCYAEIGGALGAEKMVAGSVGKIGKTYVLTIKLIDISLIKDDRTAHRDRAGEVDELLPLVDECVTELLGQ